MLGGRTSVDTLDSMRLPFFGFVFVSTILAISVVSFSACSGTEPRPDAAGASTSSGGSSTSGGSSGTPTGDAQADAGADGDAAAEPPTCNNTIRDGNETDVDCGGNVCKKCFDGKTCIANTDCAGGACLNKVCITPKCSDVATNGDETDIDCGGTICARCTIGKRCITGADCVSKTCSATKSCECPKGMTTASRQGGGGAYCIDQTEVTKFEYDKFITANVDVDDQISVCKLTNINFTPRGAWPPIESGISATPKPAGYWTGFNKSLPVHYVDWCDAYAYCKWANKQLCGGVTGGSVPPALADSADAGAWYNACSAQGSLRWPYLDVFDNRCNGIYRDSDGGGPFPDFSGYGFSINQDEGIHQVNNGDFNGNYTEFRFAQCAGGVSGLYHMSGNLAEWEDSCDGANADSKCRVRGGSFQAEGDAGTLSCSGNRLEQRMPPTTGNPNTDPLRDVGIRCCLY